MALTVSVGFVVDDAIVVIENIVRFIEDGRLAAGSGAQGRAADRVHGGFHQPVADRRVHPHPVHGRVDRAVVPRVRRDAECRHPGLGGGVADADADALRAISAGRRIPTGSAGGFTRRWSGFFDGMLRGYEHGLKWVLRHQRFMLAGDGGDACGHRWLYVPRAAEGLFPAAGHGLDDGLHRRRRRTFPSPRWSKKHQQVAAIVAADPAVATARRRSSGGRRAINNGLMFISLKPKSRAQAQRRRGDRPAAARSWRRSPASVSFCKPRRTSASGAVRARSQYQYTLESADLNDLRHWTPLLLEQAQEGTRISQDVNTDQQMQRPAGERRHRPRRRCPARHPAAGGGRHALQCVRPAAGVGHLHPAKPIPRRPGSRPALSARCRLAGQDLRQFVDGQAGAAEHDCAFRDRRTRRSRSITRGNFRPPL